MVFGWASTDRVVTIFEHANEPNRQEFSYTRSMIRLVVFFCLVLFPLRLAAASDGALHPLDTLLKAPILAADGYEVTPLADGALAGQPVVVTFFASWCPPCTIEFQEIEKVRGMFPDAGYSVVGVNLFEDFGGGKNPGRMTRFLKRTKPDFALLEGNAAIASAFGNVDRIPTMMVFNRDGEEVWRFVHVRDSEKTHATAEDIAGALACSGLNSKSH